jgi:FkbM family methyltransferase
MMINLLGVHVIPNDLFLGIQMLKDLGYHPDLIIDIGAYKGQWTESAARIFPHASFLMVEAQPDKESYLRALMSQNGLISYHIGLVGSVSSEDVTFYKMETGSSIYSENSSAPRSIIKMNMSTLDDLLAHSEKNQSVFLKMDVQGAELDVLRGARKTLERVDAILLEASVTNYNCHAPLIGNIFHYMEEIGFVLFDISEQRRSKNGLLLQADLIFVKKGSMFDLVLKMH